MRLIKTSPTTRPGTTVTYDKDVRFPMLLGMPPVSRLSLRSRLLATKRQTTLDELKQKRPSALLPFLPLAVGTTVERDGRSAASTDTIVYARQ